MPTDYIGCRLYTRFGTYRKGVWRLKIKKEMSNARTVGNHSFLLTNRNTR